MKNPSEDSKQSNPLGLIEIVKRRQQDVFANNFEKRCSLAATN